ncbi:hypothetical protein SLS59_009612 [Nothophoma quercina]|uniref:NmrA-like domain-containing protein n=1 Tax=Nothophoma quercina TaxID=749835 RepID=A0ABR3QLX7_9PLEO
MAPAILIIGATGNTGKTVVSHLPELLELSNSNYRIVGLTRSLDNPVSQKLAKLPHVEMVEKDWTTIDAAWLKSQAVAKVYIAPHNLPHQFVEESGLYVALLHAGVKYVVKVSTIVEYVSPTSLAIENLLSQPEFKSLQWTSLQPNFFTTTFLATAVGWIQKYQDTGKQEVLAILSTADGAVAMIDPEDVGKVGAHLLALEDPTLHIHARYILSGPEDVTGKDIVKLVEQYTNVKVDRAEFKATGLLTGLVEAGVFPEKLLPSLLAGGEPPWQGKTSLARTPTNKEIVELAPPKRTIADALKAMLEE